MSSETRLTLSDAPYSVRPQYLAEFDRVQNPLPRDLRILVLDYLELSQDERKAEIRFLDGQYFKTWENAVGSSDFDAEKNLVLRLEKLWNRTRPALFLQKFTIPAPWSLFPRFLSNGTTDQIDRRSLYDTIQFRFFKKENRKEYACLVTLLAKRTHDYQICIYFNHFNNLHALEKELAPDLVRLPLLELS